MGSRAARSRPRLFRLRLPSVQQPPAKPQEREANRSLRKLFRLRRRSACPVTRPLEEPGGQISAPQTLFPHPHQSRALTRVTVPLLEREIPAGPVAARFWRATSFRRLPPSAPAAAYRAPAEKVPASGLPAIPDQFWLLPKTNREAATVPESSSRPNPAPRLECRAAAKARWRCRHPVETSRASADPAEAQALVTAKVRAAV